MTITLANIGRLLTPGFASIKGLALVATMSPRCRLLILGKHEAARISGCARRHEGSGQTVAARAAGRALRCIGRGRNA